MAIREHAAAQIGILEETLARAGKTQRPLPLAYILWGLTGTFFNALFITNDWIDAHFWTLAGIGDGLTIASVIVTAYECREATRRRWTAFDRQAFVIFTVITNVLWILKLALRHSPDVSGTAYSFLWSVGIATSLIVHGAGPIRELMYGGCVLFAAVFLAAFEPPFAAVIFAVGNFCALVVPGVVLLISDRRVRLG